MSELKMEQPTANSNEPSGAEVMQLLNQIKAQLSANQPQQDLVKDIIQVASLKTIKDILIGRLGVSVEEYDSTFNKNMDDLTYKHRRHMLAGIAQQSGICRLNPDEKVVEGIIQAQMKNTEGHCPCKPERSAETLCPCKDFINGLADKKVDCCCKLFVELPKAEETK